jgi:hypothetical protein
VATGDVALVAWQPALEIRLARLRDEAVLADVRSTEMLGAGTREMER